MGKLQPRVSGVGLGILCGLAELAGTLGIPRVWGEATLNSAPFYSHALATPDIRDHFFIQAGTLEHCRQMFREKCLGQS